MAKKGSRKESRDSMDSHKAGGGSSSKSGSGRASSSKAGVVRARGVERSLLDKVRAVEAVEFASNVGVGAGSVASAASGFVGKKRKRPREKKGARQELEDAVAKRATKYLWAVRNEQEGGAHSNFDLDEDDGAGNGSSHVDDGEHKQESKKKKKSKKRKGKRRAELTSGVTDKKLHAKLRETHEASLAASTAAARAEILLTQEGGFLEPESELERTDRVTQAQVKVGYFSFIPPPLHPHPTLLPLSLRLCF